jgi:WD40 repeat protein
MRPLVCLLALTLATIAFAGPRRIGGDDGFRVGQRFDKAVLSVDGLRFALASEYGGLHVLDARTGALLQTWPDSPPALDVTFDPTGKLLVLDCAGWVRTYDPVTGRCLRELLLVASGASDQEFSMGFGQFLPGGHFVELRWRDSLLRSAGPDAVYDTTTGQRVEWVGDLDRNDRFTSSPDGKLLVRIRRTTSGLVANTDRGLTVFDGITGKVVTRVNSGDADFEAAAIRPDRRELFAILSGLPMLIDVASGEVRRLKLAEWGADFHLPTYSPDGTAIALLHTDPRLGLREWNLATGEVRATEFGFAEAFHKASYTPAGRLLTWNPSGTRLHARAIGDPFSVPVYGHRAHLTNLAFIGDDLLSLDEAGVLCRWDARTGAMRHRTTLPKEFGIRRIAPGGKVFVASESLYATFDTSRGRFEASGEAPAAPNSISPDGRWFLHWEDKQGHLFDTVRRRSLRLPPAESLWPAGCDRPPQPIWSPDGLRVALCWLQVTDDGSFFDVAVLKVPTAHLLATFRVDLNGAHSPMFASDGTLLFATEAGITAYEVTGRVRRIYTPPADIGRIHPLATSPDGRFLLVAAANRSALALLELATGSIRRRYPYPPGLALIAEPRFSPDGRSIACALGDATILLLPTDSDASPPSDAAALRANLASPDASIAGAAVVAAAQRPDAARWLRGHLTEPEATTPPHLPALFWLAELDHDDHDRRAAARRALIRQPERLPELEAALTGTASPELRRALTDLRETTYDLPILTPDALRRLRLREALDRLAKP